MLLTNCPHCGKEVRITKHEGNFALPIHVGLKEDGFTCLYAVAYLEQIKDELGLIKFGSRSLTYTQMKEEIIC